MLLYAYCLSDTVTAQMLEGAAGVRGYGPRIVNCDEFFVVVSDFDADVVKIERDSVFAHEGVVESVLQHTTPLPFRFGTLTSLERLNSFVTENRAALLEGLERVRDSVEMNVKIIWDVEAVRREALSAEAKDALEKGEAHNLGKGAAYLAAKRKEILGDELLKKRAEELADWLNARVGEAATEQVVRLRPAETLCLKAAYLVHRAALADYQARVEAAKSGHKLLRFLTSGPWPPYSFTNINP